MKTLSIIVFADDPYGAHGFVAGTEHDVLERLPCKLTTENVELELRTIPKLEVGMKN